MTRIQRAPHSGPTFWRHLTNMAMPRRRVKDEIIYREYEDDDEDLDYTHKSRISLENVQTLNKAAELVERAKKEERFVIEETGEPRIRPMTTGASEIIVPGMLIDRSV